MSLAVPLPLAGAKDRSLDQVAMSPCVFSYGRSLADLLLGFNSAANIAEKLDSVGTCQALWP
jgi:hypothetical protein